MVVDQSTETGIDRIFQALADATRRDIVSRVITASHSVTSLAEHYDMSFAAVQKHVQVLERALLVTKERRGREQLVRGRIDTIGRAAALLQAYEEIWAQRALRIDEILAENPKKEQS
ncbi:winged helix-turn-helix transcriptional regulator [Agreia pratensis]|uniref:ArsR/SmtB family transcription factor n=1 Tax=Agreia pratensis TaxID=150121 RepID=UPI00188B3268|nr:helix-turn-helix domain-containing protein [Agreia pratensis]MBF4634628.1 winged helix-turn-helix transcriptional regulator [Agreia pratensis]